jgi:hypothetical protein
MRRAKLAPRYVYDDEFDEAMIEEVVVERAVTDNRFGHCRDQTIVPRDCVVDLLGSRGIGCRVCVARD